MADPDSGDPGRDRAYALGVLAAAPRHHRAVALVSLALRLLAILLCLLAALRPKVTLNEKKKQAASLVYLIDTSKSMLIADEVNGQSRWDVAKEIVKQAEEMGKMLGPDLNVKVHFFDSTLTDPKPNEQGEYAKPQGLETKLGAAILEANKAEQSNAKRIARMVIVIRFHE